MGWAWQWRASSVPVKCDRIYEVRACDRPLGFRNMDLGILKGQDTLIVMGWSY